jgi:hypothetical protein
VLFATFTWDGGGADANWTTADNWAGDVVPVADGSDDLVFPAGAAQKSNNNDFADGTAFASITVEESGYTLAGNGVAIGTAGVSDTSPTGANTVSLPLVLAGSTTVSDSTGNSSNALTLSGVISGSGSLSKSGSGSVILTAANAYIGGTTLAGGNTFANNASGSAFGTGDVTNTSGTLRGNGSFTGALFNNSGLAPGATNPGPGAAGTLATGNLDFGVSANYSVTLLGATAGSGYDQLVVTGTVDLDTGHALALGGSYAGTAGDKLFVLVNDGSDTITGTFASLDEGDTVSLNSVDYFISYQGDSVSGALTGGNDVVLYVGVPNAAPANTVPGTQTTGEDIEKFFSAAGGNAITVADADAGSANIQVRLTANAGATITLSTGGLITAGANASGDVTLTGSQTAINAALDGMSVSPAANSTATITLTVATDDLGNTGGGGATTDSEDVTINVTAINDAPVISAPGAQDTLVNTSLTFSSANSNLISLADVDAGGSGVQVTLTATNGMLSLGGTSGLSFSDGDGSADTTMTFTGTVSAINTALTNLAFTPDSGYIGAASIHINVDDQGNTGGGGAQTDVADLAITVNGPQTIELAAATFNVAENVGAGVGVVTLTRSGGTSGTQVVNFTTSAGTATNAQDFTVAVGTVTFLPGEATKTFTVPVIDDALDEDNETINVSIGPVTSGGATVGAQSTATLTIVDNDGTPGLTIGNAVVIEGNAGTTSAAFTVTLNAASGRTITVDYTTVDGTATVAGSDYSTASGTLTFTPGQTTKTIMVNATGDGTIEPDETFSIALSNASNVTIIDGNAAGIIADDDDSARLTLSAERDFTITEGNSGTSDATFTVNLNTAAAGTVTVSYATVGITATEGDDYTNTTGVLTFTPGQTSKTITIPVVGDAFDEPNESLSLVLTGPTGGATLLDDTGVLIIADNDPTPSVSIADATAAEGTGLGNALTFTVTLSAASNIPVAIDYETTSGTATADADYTPLDGTLTFAAGETSKTITVNTVGDASDENSETLFLTIKDIRNAIVGDGQAVGTITDDDLPPSISVNDVTVAEPTLQGTTATAEFTVTLSAPSSRTIAVDFATSPGTATNDVDYTLQSGSLEFAPGETTKTISVAVLFDGVDEPSETFTLVLSNPTNAALGTATGTATITNIAPNQPPVTADDVVLLGAGQPFADISVLANDTDADGDPLVASVATQPTHGLAGLNADGTIRYTPAAGYSGADSFIYTASDGRGGTSTATVNLTVTGNAAVVDPSNPKKTNLFLAGTSGNDSFEFVKVKRQYKVLVNGAEQGTFTVNGKVTISGGDGDDTLTIGKLKLPVIFNGGAGNDTLIAAGKGAILVGGAGNDTIKGGGGKDVIIGGDGADILDGVGGSDLIVSGSTIYDADTPANRHALADLLAEMAKGGKYATKLANLAAGVGASGAKLAPNVTAFDDADADTITGGGGQDIYVARTATSVMDALNKKAKNESVIEL